MIRLALALAMIATPALAERQCAGHTMIADALAKNFSEVRRSIGLAQDNTVMELYASDKTGTWTLTVTMPSGMTCLVAAGSNFETVAPATPVKPGVPS